MLVTSLGRSHMMLNRKLIGLLVGTSVAVGAGLGAGAASSTDAATAAEQRRASLQQGMPSPSTFVLAVEQAVDGRTWALGRSVNARGEKCLELRAPAGWRSGTCLTASQESSAGPISAYTGGVPGISFLHGVVSPAITKLELVRADCSRQPVALSTDGLFLLVTPASAASPWQLRGLGSTGELVSTHVLGGRGAGNPAPGSC